MDAISAERIARKYLVENRVEIGSLECTVYRSYIPQFNGPGWMVCFNLLDSEGPDFVDSVTSVLVLVDDVTGKADHIPGL